MNTKYLPRSLAIQLLNEAQMRPEKEVCGLISSLDGAPNRLIPIDNIAVTPETLFEMDPHQQIDAMREIREQGEQLWAIYHSHPHTSAAPSPRDLSEAAYPEPLYLVVSLNTEGVLEMQGYRLQNDHFEEVALETTQY